MNQADINRIAQLEEENRLLKERLEQMERDVDLIVEEKTSEAVADLRRSQQIMHTVLNNVAADILVTEFDTMKILFANEHIKKKVPHIQLEGKECWKTLQVGLTEKCEFCPQYHLWDSDGSPTGVYFWEDFNEVLKQHIALNYVGIEWIDGRKAHLEVGIDVTRRKSIETELEKLSRSQAILIKVLKIVQSADDLPRAMNEAVAEIGKYTGVSRVHVFEKTLTTKLTTTRLNGATKASLPTRKICKTFRKGWYSHGLICLTQENTTPPATMKI